MRIPCPFCGPRGHEEFVYHGDATVVRPAPDRPDVATATLHYVYLRTNPAGWHRELWFHAFGCEAWIVVLRDTETHAIGRAWAAGGAAPEEER
jgi:sarcosine oxidase subunit delta